MSDTQPVTILIGALGGEGGGLLTDWLVLAARAAGLPVQSTSIPGVAQRTGATTYYIEMLPTPVAELDGRRPVFALYPGIGDHLLEKRQGLANMVPGRQFGNHTPVLGVDSYLAIHAVRQQAALTVVERDARFVAGSFNTKDYHDLL